MQQAAPALTWLILTTVGVLLLAAVIGWAVLRYQRSREDRTQHTQPMD